MVDNINDNFTYGFGKGNANNGKAKKKAYAKWREACAIFWVANPNATEQETRDFYKTKDAVIQKELTPLENISNEDKELIKWAAEKGHKILEEQIWCPLCKRIHGAIEHYRSKEMIEQDIYTEREAYKQHLQDIKEGVKMVPIDNFLEDLDHIKACDITQRPYEECESCQ